MRPGRSITKAAAARPTRRAVIAGGAASLCFSASASAAPSSVLLAEEWRTFGAAGDPEAEPWAAFLSNWLRPGENGVTRVDYKGALAAGARAPLRDWLAATQTVDPTALARGAAMAWWINLYNAATLDLVLGAYPVESILRIEGGLFNTGPWDEKVLTVNGQSLSLNDVEHGILRPIWRDPRIHYAVNCASIGCPDLAGAPWGSGDLDERLSAAAEAYVNHPRGARVEAGELTVSKIYEWYQADFGGSDAGVIDHLKAYAKPDLAAALGGVSRIAEAEYDWSLNAA